MKHFVIFLFSCVVLIGCGFQAKKEAAKNRKNPVYIEAQDWYKKSQALRDEVDAQLQEMTASPDSLTTSIIESATTQLDEWDKNVILVPGFEHDHDHKDCKHNHNVPDFAPEKHLEVQKALYQEIQTLNEQLKITVTDTSTVAL